VFENRVLRRIFGPKRDEVTGDWRKLRNEELHSFYCLQNIIRMIQLRRMGWEEACSTHKRRDMHTWIRQEKQKERDHLEDLGLVGG
jgi:hypothetical protein